MVGQYAYYGNVYYEDDPKFDGNLGKFTVTGTADLLSKLDNALAIMPDAVIDRLEMHAEKILSDSKEEVPWDTTHLLQTGTIEPFQEGDLKGFEIGYNAKSDSNIHEGYPYNYGLRQHEDLTLYHPKPGAKAKFLEDPFNRHKDKIIPDIVSFIDDAFSQGIPNMAGMVESQKFALGNLGGRFAGGPAPAPRQTKSAQKLSALGNLGGRFI